MIGTYRLRALYTDSTVPTVVVEPWASSPFPASSPVLWDSHKRPIFVTAVFDSYQPLTNTVRTVETGAESCRVADFCRLVTVARQKVAKSPLRLCFHDARVGL